MDTQELPLELQLALDKTDRKDTRIEHSQGYGQTTGGLAITEAFLGRLTEAVKENLDTGVAGNSTVKPLLPVVRGLKPEVIALCALQSLLHAVATKLTLLKTLLVLGSNLAGECWAAKLTNDNPRLAARIRGAVKRKHGDIKYRRQAARSIAARAGFQQRNWTYKEQMKAGKWLLNIALQALPDVFETLSVGGEKDGKQVIITEAALSIADEAVASLITRNPVYLPMTQEPRPWTDWNVGGVWDERVTHNLKFLRVHYKDSLSALKHAIKSGQMKPALDAVNALQNVAWTINTRVLDVFKACWDQGVNVKGLPPKEDLPKPKREKPWDDMSDDEKRVWRHRANETEKANRSFIGERILVTEDLSTAEALAEHPRFWTPMNCDWRGRVYAICHFNFQRDDRVRGMFLFADGAPIGEEGLWWLKVHVANCGDFDKISKRPLKERVEWVDRNMDLIRECVRSPLRFGKDWMQADKPFLFLASCMELTAALAEGPTFVTRLPVSFDGSCSGLQHLCAMTRAPEGSFVNLTPNTLPQDVYQAVADRVVIRIKRDAEHGDQEHKALAEAALRYGITRKVVKRNVMTYSYSSKSFGMAEQQREDLMKPLAFDVLQGKLEAHPFGEDDGHAASKYIAKHVYAAIEEIVHLPAAAMRYLQAIARALAHEGKPVRWTTPVGIPWINRYHEPIVERVELYLYDRGAKVRSTVNVATGNHAEIDKGKAANGVAPNFVHALDAAHLLLVALASVAEGIKQIATVHDSFGCLAPQAARFNQIIRAEFVRMYETHDVLSEVLEQSKCDLTHANWNRLPDPMDRGPLNLKEVLNADYAFA